MMIYSSDGFFQVLLRYYCFLILNVIKSSILNVFKWYTKNWIHLWLNVNSLDRDSNDIKHKEISIGIILFFFSGKSQYSLNKIIYQKQVFLNVKNIKLIHSSFTILFNELW